jgi:ABC-type antimicrobial peptide transport system permease subunit
MYAAVARRTKEIGTLRSLGFSRASILNTFLFESIVISLAGGVLGLVAASFLDLIQISTTNFNTMSELAFNFSLNPRTIIVSMIFALVMGFVGGFLPAVRASRLKIVDALRAA